MISGTTASVVLCRRLHHRAVRRVSTGDRGEWRFFLVLDARRATENADDDGEDGDEAAPRENPRAGHRCDWNVKCTRWHIARFLSRPFLRA